MYQRNILALLWTKASFIASAVLGRANRRKMAIMNSLILVLPELIIEKKQIKSTTAAAIMLPSKVL